MFTFRKFIVACSFALLPLAAMAEDIIVLSHLYTTHIVFPAEVTYTDLSAPKDVKVQVLEQNRNMIRIRARHPFEGSSSLSVLESNGEIHTFYIMYEEKPAKLIYDVKRDFGPKIAAAPANETRAERRRREKAEAEARKMEQRQEQAAAAVDEQTASVAVAAARVDAEEKAAQVVVDDFEQAPAPRIDASGPVRGNVAPTLSDVLACPQKLHHIGAKQYGLQAYVENVLVYNDVTYLVISLKNGSAISYAADALAFAIESRKTSRRDVPQNDSWAPRSRLGSLFAAPGEEARVVYCFDKITLTGKQVFKVYIYEDQGQRDFVLTLYPNDINNADRYVAPKR